MHLKDFKLERYFAQYEFSAKYLLSSSDCDGFEMAQLLEMADASEMALWNNLTLGYTESAGHPLLREAILEHYELKGIEKVLVASPGELNFMTMNVLLKPSDHVIVISPAYQSLYEIVRSLGCEISFWKPNPANWHYDPAALADLVQPNTRLIIINFPHNPTGSYLKQKELDQIIHIARKNDLYLFSDEMYQKLLVTANEELKPVCDQYEKGISLWGTSKTFGLAGLRIGWLVSQDQDFMNKVQAFKDYLSICNSAPSEILSIIALNQAEKLIHPNLQKIKKNVEHFSTFAAEHSIIDRFVPPQAGSTAFVKLNLQGTAQQFSDHLVEQAGIMTLPAEMFDYEGTYIRVGFGRQNFPDVLRHLAQHL